jgi:hypothetical protein
VRKVDPVGVRQKRGHVVRVRRPRQRGKFDQEDDPDRGDARTGKILGSQSSIPLDLKQRAPSTARLWRSAQDDVAQGDTWRHVPLRNTTVPP